ncbi:MAG: glycosyltransferase, partial [Candidatus Omnitrophica bacterium]|nr:glycosyltransferase [Candidatus Omnitrophota bacterium]
YYPLPVKFNFNYLMVKAFNIADKFCVHSADMTWHISPRIAEARQKFAKVNPQSYKYLTVPLTYAQNIQRFKPLEEVERYTIGFVGTLSENQGLQLLIKAMPEIIKKIPQVRVKIIGKGPYELTLKKMANDAGLNSYLNFVGFIREEEKVLNILANCAIGVAPWTCSPDDNILYADPGKPKLYAFCGIPTVITNGTPIAQELNSRRAGVSINYDRVELARAIIELLGDETKLKEYKKNSSELARDYTSEKIFDRVFQEMIQVEGKR